MSTDITDEQLAKEYLTGKKPEALELLIGKYLPRIFGYIKRYTGNNEAAADITQETFVKVWKNIGRFDTSASFSTWIFTIAKRTAIDEMRKKNAIPFSLIQDEKFIGNISVPSGIPEEFRKKELILALTELPDKNSHVIKLYLEGFNFREIGDGIGESVHTVKSRYRRGLAALKKILNR